MFRTRVLYLWLRMIGAFLVLLLAAATASALSAQDDSLLLVPLLLLPLALGGCLVAIVGSLPMLWLMQQLLIAAGNRCGRPASFRVFRQWLVRYSLGPASGPLLLLLVPAVRHQSALAAVGLGLWAVATVAVWCQQARRLHAEWQAGRPY